MDIRYPEPPPQTREEDEDLEDMDPFFESAREIHLYEVL